MSNRRRNRTRRFAALHGCAVACVISSVPARSLADAQGDGLKTTFVIDDADPESKVPSPQEAMRAPLQMGYWVMLVSDRAEGATKRGDLLAAVKYYRAIAKATPDRAVGFKRMCTTYEAMDDWENAVGSCQVVLEKAGVAAEDYTHFVRLLLSKKDPLTEPEISNADAAIAHLQEELGKPPVAGADPAQSRAQIASGKVLVERLKCQVGARLEDRKRLEACANALRMLAPKDPGTVAFAFALALTKHDFDQAEQLIASAKQFGLNDSGVAFMKDKLRRELDRAPLWSRVFGNARVLVATLALLGLLVALAFFARRRFGLRVAQ